MNISKKHSQCLISPTVIGSQQFQRVSEFGIITANNYRHCFLKLCSIFHLFHVKLKRKGVWSSEIIQLFHKCFTEYDTRALQIVCKVIMGLSHNLVFLFQVENWLLGKCEHIQYLWRFATNFLHSFTIYWENNRLLNKNYWDDLDIIDQGHSKGSISQFCLYLGYPWTNFNTILTTKMASWPAKKKCRIIWSSKCRSRTPFTKIAVSQLLYDGFLLNVYRNNGNVVENKNVISADLQNIGQGHHLQKSYLGYYTAEFNQTFTKMILLGWQQKHPVHWPWKYRSRSHFVKINILVIIKTIWTKFSSKMIMRIPELSRLYMQALISLP